MIGLLDPAFLLPRANAAQEQTLVHEIDLLLQTCRRFDIAVPPFDEYWPDLWATLGRGLEASLQRADARAAVRQLRRLGETSRRFLPAGPAVGGQVWRRGFKALFGWSPLNGSWERRMAEAAVRAAGVGQDVVLLVRLVVGRNLIEHKAQNSTLRENHRWVLHIQPKILGHRQIACIHHPRNLSEKWTTRFDWRLPAVSDGARYPFCAPSDWWKPTTAAVRTVQGKPCFVDARQNGWARPSIPGGAGYHWDVYIHDGNLAARIGLNPINVAEFGATDRGRPAGSLHHVAEDNKSQLRNDCGWSCP